MLNPAPAVSRCRRDCQLLILWLLCLALCGTPTLAAEIRPWPDTGAAPAGAIVHGQVVATTAAWREDAAGKHLYTQATLRVAHYLLGQGGDELIVEVIGGNDGTITEEVSDSFSLHPGEEVVLVLDATGSRPLAGAWSKFSIVDGMAIGVDSMLPLAEFARDLRERHPDSQVPADWSNAAEAARRDPEAEGIAYALANPQIVAITPNQASAGTNSEVTITGSGFGAAPGTVSFFYRSGQPRINAAIVSWSDTRIVCTVPVATVNNYSASAGSGPIKITNSSGYTTAGFPFRVSFGNGQKKWAGTAPVITYRVNENTGDCSGEGAAVQAAANTWNAVGANFTFNYGGASTATTSSYDGQNNLLWGSTSGSIATNYYWYNTSTGQILDFDIIFNNPNYQWSTATPTPSTAMDVRTIALHELGHALNLRDLYGNLDATHDSGKVMYGFAGNGKMRRSLTSYDQDGIWYLYTPSDPPVCVAPATLTHPASDSDGTYTVTWSASTTGNATYTLEEATSADFAANRRVVYSGKQRQVAIGGRQAGMPYFYRVKASASLHNDSPWTTGATSCKVGRPGKPTAITVPTVVANATVNVSWGASPTPDTSYLLQEATDSLFSKNRREVYLGPGLASAVSVAVTGQKYFYRVKAIKDGFPDSLWKSAITGCKVGAPAVAGPLTVPTQDPDGNYTVTWSRSLTPGVSYTLQESTDVAFPATAVTRVAYSGTGAAAPIAARVKGKSYYYRIKATKTGYPASAWTTAATPCVVGP